MRLAAAVAVLATGPLIACGAPRATQSTRCGASFPAIPPNYVIKGRHEIRLGSILDTFYASRSVARLVFRVRSTYGVNLGDVVGAYTVVLGDSVIKDLPPLGAVGDSTGVAVLNAVPVAYTFAHVRRIGYGNHAVPLVLRPGYTDTVFVALASGPVCLLE